MKHIIDTVSKLRKECDVMCGDSPHDVRIYNEAIDDALDNLRALIASSPQADANTPPDVYDIAVDTGDGIYHTAEVVHFQQSGSKRMIQVRLGEPQADDVPEGWKPKLGDIVNPSKSCCEKYSEWKPDEQMKIVAMAYKRNYSRVISDEIEYTTIELANPDLSMTDGWKREDIALAASPQPPSAQQDDVRKDAWISVDDRLPIEGTIVLIYVKAWGMALYTGYLNIDGLWCDADGEELDGFNNPSYWQPLPSPPLDKASE